MPFDYLKVLSHRLTPKKALTSFAGLCADVKNPWIKNYLIKSFIQRYQVVMSEAYEEDPENYACFNDFFIRQLKPETRPLAQADIISPVDGIISEIGTIHQGQIVQAKAHHYTVAELLAVDEPLAAQFVEGRFATFYLSPKDYHRIHLPLDATINNMHYLPGKLFSVQPTTVNRIPKLFARNERLVIFLETKVGLMAMVLVGATIVGAIATSWHGEISRTKTPQYFDYQEQQYALQQGEEVGYFKLGSTVILLFTNGTQMEWLSHLCSGQKIQYGQAIGAFISY